MSEDLWLQFDNLGNFAKCRHCQKLFPLKAGPSLAGLRVHLEQNHGHAPEQSTSSMPRQLSVTSTTLTTDDLFSKDYSTAIKSLETSEHSDTDTQNNSQNANTESSDVDQQFPKKVLSVLEDLDRSPPRPRAIRRKRPSLRGGGPHIDTDEDFGRLISKKMHQLPLAIRCGLEVEILRMVNSALNAMETL